MKFSDISIFIIMLLATEHTVAQDTIPPTLICHDTLSLIMDEVNGFKKINTMDFVKQASDDQTRPQDLRFYVNGIPQDFIVTCDTFACRGASDLVHIPLIISCQDEEGNQSSCPTTLIVRDELDICQEGRNGIMVDVFLYSFGDRIPGIPFVFREIDGSRQYLTPLELPLFISSSGCRIDGTLYPLLTNKDSLSGIGTKDLVVLYRHLLGIRSFEHPYQYIAADLNGDGRITVTDLTLLRSIIQGKKNFSDLIFQSSWLVFSKEAPIISDWTSWKNYVYKDISATLSEYIPYYAVKLGDVSMDYIP